MTLSQNKTSAPLLLFLFVFSAVHAQTGASPYRASNIFDSSFWHGFSVAARVQYGSFMDDLSKLQYVEDGRTILGEIDLAYQTSGSRSWQQPANFPQVGMAFLYGQSGASVYIGHVAALLPFINFHLKAGKEATTDLRLAFGPALVQRTFDPETNYQNLVIGSHLNACVNIMLSESIRLFPHTSIELGLSFTHISNGSIKLPNLGLNVPSLTAGFRYDLFPRQERSKSELPPHSKKTNFYLLSFVAAKESLPLESAVYLVNVFEAEVLKDFSRTGRFGGGVDLTLDRANSREIPYSPTFKWDRSKSQWEVSIYAVYEYKIGNLSFPLKVGYYLYNNYRVTSLYESVGIKYQVTSHWSAGYALKAHLGNGDFMQWGLGYKF